MIVNGKLNLGYCESLTSLGKLKKVKEDLFCSKSLKDLGDLEEVGNSGITKEYVKENYPHLFIKCKW